MSVSLQKIVMGQCRYRPDSR